MLGSICAQGGADLVHRVILGFNQLRSSSVPAFTMPSGTALGSLNIGVPHSGQNCRVTVFPLSVFEAKPLIVPCLILIAPGGMTTTLAAAPARDLLALSVIALDEGERLGRQLVAHRPAHAAAGIGMRYVDLLLLARACRPRKTPELTGHSHFMNQGGAPPSGYWPSKI